MIEGGFPMITEELKLRTFLLLEGLTDDLIELAIKSILEDDDESSQNRS